MKKFYSVCCTALCALCAACSSEPATFSGFAEVSRIRLVPAIMSRVSGTDFESGDRIGVSIFKDAAAYLDNRLFTYDGYCFSADDAFWYAEAGATSTITAYYPYSAAGLPQTFSVRTDQRGDALAQSDLLGACLSDAVPSEAPVALTFRHLFALVEIELSIPENLAVEQITVDGFTPTAAVDLKNLTATVATAAPAAITVHERTPNQRYSVVLPPQTADLSVAIHTTDAEDPAVKTLSEVQLQGGKRYTLELTLSEQEQRYELQLSSDIVDWEEGGSLGSDTDPEDPNHSTDPTDPTDPDDQNPEKTDNVNFHGVNYAVRTINGRSWLAENLRCEPAGATAGSDFFYPNGDPSQAGELGLFYTFATATAGAQPEGNLRGICPEGWRLPQIGELTELAASADRSFFTDTGYMMLRAPGETQYLTDKSYWITSSAGDGDKRIYLRILANGGSVESWSLAPTTVAASVRCVKE